jgi:hypothetical protein
LIGEVFFWILLLNRRRTVHARKRHGRVRNGLATGTEGFCWKEELIDYGCLLNLVAFSHETRLHYKINLMAKSWEQAKDTADKCMHACTT